MVHIINNKECKLLKNYHKTSDRRALCLVVGGRKHNDPGCKLLSNIKDTCKYEGTVWMN